MPTKPIRSVADVKADNIIKGSNGCAGAAFTSNGEGAFGNPKLSAKKIASNLDDSASRARFLKCSKLKAWDGSQGVSKLPNDVLRLEGKPPSAFAFVLWSIDIPP